MDVDSGPPSAIPSSPPDIPSPPSISPLRMSIMGHNVYIDSAGRYHHEPGEEQRRQFQQMWRDLDKQAAEPDVVRKREILKITQSYDFQQVQAKVKAKLIKLGFLQEAVELASVSDLWSLSPAGLL
ncbi:hypothetical protein [Phaffia rhodozyma]|uniref:Uncharacterized protein n=1 Tax=Phaffia rhodozyma TaxID=264483 RepID=A0A0F7SG77_PHARH|nr:hypothetical protein [Phaffia rhodozyma]